MVLNQNYQPLNICSVKRAFVLLGHAKAEPLVDGEGSIRTIIRAFPVPSVIRLMHFVKRPSIYRKLSRKGVFHRDGFICQYCGIPASDLTLDHILPRSRGGEQSWENVVSACIPCNHRKAGLTPKEAQMRLKKAATTPRPNPYYLFHNRPIMDEWRQFIPWAL